VEIFFPDTGHIEDFPYCNCCDPQTKLNNRHDFPLETLHCPKSNAEYSLYDRYQKHDRLVHAYFPSDGGWLRLYDEEYRRLKELKPDITDQEIIKELFKQDTLRELPDELQRELRERFKEPMELVMHIAKNFLFYRGMKSKNQPDSNDS